METNQLSSEQDPMSSQAQPQQSSPNSRLFILIVISVLLTAMITGPAVYSWQKSASEKAIRSLEQKIALLEEQISAMESVEVEPQLTLSLPTADTVDNWETYVNSEQNFEFKYPQNLKPLKLSNGVVTFLPEDAHDSCKAAQGSKDINAFEPCYKEMFNFNGYQTNPSENYEEYVKDVKGFATLSSFTDDKNRTWKTSLVFGQVYNFEAFTQIESVPIHISFQYGFDAPSEREILSFFNQILSTFRFAD